MAYEHKPRGAGDLILSADWNAIGGEVERVAGLLAQDEKKETVTLPIPLRVFGKGSPKSPLSVAGGAAIGAGYADKHAAPTNGLIVEGSAGIGTPSPQGKLQVIHQEQDANGNALVLGPDSGSNLRLGYHADHSWIQSHGGKPLKINPLGSDVSLGPHVVVKGDGTVGIGTGEPRSALDTGQGVMSGAPNDYTKAQFTMSGGGVVTWGGPGGRLKWTKRFIAISMERGLSFAEGYVDLLQPTSDIPAENVYDGKPRAADADGVVLQGWDALYAVHTPGGTRNSVVYRIERYTRAFNAPSNWILVAVVNHDDSTVKLGTGAILAKGGDLPRLDVAEAFGATVRAADFYLGHSGRRGTPGRALVDLKDMLCINYGSDWSKGVRVHSELEVTGTSSLTQEAWQTVKFQDGWTNYGERYNPAAYFKDSMGIVHLRGLVKNGGLGYDKTIFTLPVGYRPEHRQLFVNCRHDQASGRADVETDGRVIPISGSSTWFSLDGLTFRAK